jgi:hypothetical protein
MMADAFIQEDSDHDTIPIVTNLNNSKASSRGRYPCRATTKNFRDAWPSSGPAVDPSRVGKSHEVEQAKIKEFFYPNPTPARPTVIEEDGDDEPELVSIRRAEDALSNKTSTAAAASVTTNTAAAVSTAAAASIFAITAGGGAPSSILGRTSMNSSSRQ